MERLSRAMLAGLLASSGTLALAALPCLGAEVPKDPILRIETGTHGAAIPRIGMDSSGRWLVTGSEDKTVRVWDLSDGSLHRVLRLPIGPGDEGKIFAVAVSPDGNTIACGGWTGLDWEGSASIYVFDRQSNRLVRRIKRLPNVIAHLAYSKDGRFLAAGLGGSNGVRVFNVPGYSLIAKDADCGDTSLGVDFDVEGRLVASSNDGFVRLYDRDFKLIAKAQAPGGKKPFQVMFSPDGSRIAVGFDDSTNMNVLSGKDLSLLYSPDTRGVTNGNLSSVAWSADSKFLYAGGLFNAGGFPIRRWSLGGRGQFEDIPASGNSIMHLLPHGEGVAFGSFDPAFGLLSQGKRTLFKEPALADFRNDAQGSPVSFDGSTVQFAYEVFGKSPARFSVLDRSIELAPQPDDRVLAPRTEASGLSLKNWENTTHPSLNNKALSLLQFEMSRSLAIAPDDKTFLLGSNWRLRLFDREGSQKWEIPVPGNAWSVNIAGNNKTAVAAFGDGTVRWYRLSDGKELLAFFPHKDRKRWVLWTPSGYYDASPGGEDLIGWHVNNGPDNAADFYPASRFRDSYYRPDVVAKVLDVFDEAEALRLADLEAGRKKKTVEVLQLLPPVVNIISPLDGELVSANEVLVRFSVRAASGEPVTGVKALVNGRPAAARRGMKVVPKEAGEVQELLVPIPSQDSVVSIMAENRHGSGEPASVRLRWKGRVARDEFVVKPKLYVLAVGVSKYKDKGFELGYPAKDAQDFAALMRRQAGGLYREVEAKVLVDGEATKSGILDGLEWVEQQTTAKDVAMLFLAGHGVNDRTGNYYFMPWEGDSGKLKSTGVEWHAVKTTVESLPGKTLVFVDTCHAGGVMGKRRGSTDITALVNELSSAENGAVVFAASTGNQYSLEKPEWSNGAFTKAILEGLGGKADYSGKKKVTVNMLDLYLSERVKDLTRGQQTPTTTKPQTVPDFPVAAVK